MSESQAETLAARALSKLRRYRHLTVLSWDEAAALVSRLEAADALEAAEAERDRLADALEQIAGMVTYNLGQTTTIGSLPGACRIARAALAAPEETPDA